MCYDQWHLRVYYEIIAFDREGRNVLHLRGTTVIDEESQDPKPGSARRPPHMGRGGGGHRFRAKNRAKAHGLGLLRPEAGG